MEFDASCTESLSNVLYIVVVDNHRKRLAAFRIDADLWAAMERLRIRDGINASEMIRRALRPWLRSKGVLQQVAVRTRERHHRRG